MGVAEEEEKEEAAVKGRNRLLRDAVSRRRIRGERAKTRTTVGVEGEEFGSNAGVF